ncbi:hypothetical protein ACWDZ4_03150 [Streptomyces sp. NPDC003016]
MTAGHKTPGDPRGTGWGALVAAAARHDAEISGTAVCGTSRGWSRRARRTSAVKPAKR